jgi:hypothetical protein
VAAVHKAKALSLSSAWCSMEAYLIALILLSISENDSIGSFYILAHN